MQLAAYMEEKSLDDEAFAELIEPGLSPWTVRKWRYRQRIPRPEMQRRIMQVTDGKVTPNDWMALPEPAAVAS
jgi:hypothetical protein